MSVFLVSFRLSVQRARHSHKRGPLPKPLPAFCFLPSLSDTTMSTEEQLVSFFAYSFFIYPVTNYLISPSRPYRRWQGALYAVLFLLLVSVLHLAYENREKGPNHYQVLQIARGTSDSKLKQKYRQLSLLTHPDKNKAPSAAAEFHRITQAYTVLQDPEKRRVYERLGDAGVKVFAQSAIDHKYIMIQMLVFYASSAIFAFLMTFSEPSGDALGLSAFGLVGELLGGDASLSPLLSSPSHHLPLLIFPSPLPLCPAFYKKKSCCLSRRCSSWRRCTFPSGCCATTRRMTLFPCSAASSQPT